MSESSSASIPDPDSRTPDDSVVSTGPKHDRDLSHLPAEHRDIVARLRTQVARAATTIEELQAENERLKERVRELETRPAVPEDQTALALDDDPDRLRKHITSFIDAIDTYLEHGEPEERPEEAAGSVQDEPSS